MQKALTSVVELAPNTHTQKLSLRLMFAVVLSHIIKRRLKL